MNLEEEEHEVTSVESTKQKMQIEGGNKIKKRGEIEGSNKTDEMRNQEEQWKEVKGRRVEENTS